MNLFLGRFLVLWLVVGFGLRLYFAFEYPVGAVAPGFRDYVLGALADLLAFGFVTLLMGIAWLMGNKALKICAGLVIFVFLVVSIAEIFFWLEFQGRLDRLVFHYLAYPHEVVVFLEEQFAMSLFLLPLLLVVWLVGKVVGWPARKPSDDGSVPAHPSLLALAASLFLLLGAAWLPAVTFTPHRMLSEFSSNGFLGIFHAAIYDIEAIDWLSESSNRKIPASNGEITETGEGSRLTLLSEHNAAVLAGKSNVVLIIEESFAGEVWDGAQLRRKYLPHFSEVAARSISFSNIYATGSRTTRGLEALLNGYMPLPGISTTERNGFGKLPSLARGMDDGGFYPVFLYGGWPGFSNFSDYWQATGFKEIWTRNDFEVEFETSWGVADAELFDRILLEMDVLTESHARVFLSTLTVSHHRPYDFPGGLVNFSSDSRERAHAMAYADASLGRFLRMAQSKEWYNDTLFVVVADHGPMTRGDTVIPVAGYRLPLLFFGTGIDPVTIDELGSTMSLPKTLVSLLNIRTEEEFFGRSLVKECHENSGCRKTAPVEYGYHIGEVSDTSLTVINKDGRCLGWRRSDKLSQFRFGQNEELSAHPCQSVISAFAPAYARFYNP